MDLSKIISGGQTGVDRAALDAAMARAMDVGGWCPEGRLAEDGPINERYPLKELPGAGYRERTLQNVNDSDGTLIIYFGEPIGGTKQTIACCNNEGKPKLLIDAETSHPANAAARAIDFIKQHDISVLNIAGPRASSNAKAYKYAKAIVREILKTRA